MQVGVSFGGIFIGVAVGVADYFGYSFELFVEFADLTVRHNLAVFDETERHYIVISRHIRRFAGKEQSAVENFGNEPTAYRVDIQKSYWSFVRFARGHGFIVVYSTRIVHAVYRIAVAARQQVIEPVVFGID